MGKKHKIIKVIISFCLSNNSFGRGNVFAPQKFSFWFSRFFFLNFLSFFIFLVFLAFVFFVPSFLNQKIFAFDLYTSDLDIFEQQIQKQFTRKDFHKARVLCEALPQNARYHVRLQLLCGKTYTFLADHKLAVLKENRRYARQYFSRVINALQPMALQKRNASIFLQEAYFYRGLNSFFHRNYDEAMKDFSMLLRFEPNHKAALFNMAVCLEESGKSPEAARYYLRLYNLDKKFIANHLLSRSPGNR